MKYPRAVGAAGGVVNPSVSEADMETRSIEETEEPTKPIAPIASRALVRWARVDRLAELAIERLTCGPDDDAITAALQELTEIRAIAGGEIR